MAAPIKVRRAVKSLGILLPRDVVELLGVAEGDEFFAPRMPDGIQLTPYDPDFAKVINSARDNMSRHREALQELSRRRSR